MTLLTLIDNHAELFTGTVIVIVYLLTRNR